MNKGRTAFLAFLMITVMSVASFAGQGGIVIPKGTLIKIRLEKSLSTKTNKTGEMVDFSVADALGLLLRMERFFESETEK